MGDLNAAVEIRDASAEEVIDLRHAVLRPGFPREEAIFPTDRDPATRHFVAVIRAEAAGRSDRIVGCVTLTPRPFDGRHAVQLRAMAVDERCRGAGVGRALLAAVDQHIRALAPPPTPLLWCNARVGAIGFYQRCGWTVVSEVFEQPPIGPHVKMIRQL